jgi:hypothetical protein
MYQASEHSGPVVHSSNQKRGAVHLKYALSIKLIAYASATIIVFLFIGITAINLNLSKTHYQGSNTDLPQYLTDKATAIATQLSLFNKIIRNVATQPTIQDILEHRDEAGAQAWALQMRRFLPQALGVTLLTSNGKVMGDPPGKRLTPQCLTDMSKINQREATKISVKPQRRPPCIPTLRASPISIFRLTFLTRPKIQLVCCLSVLVWTA